MIVGVKDQVGTSCRTANNRHAESYFYSRQDAFLSSSSNTEITLSTFPLHIFYSKAQITWGREHTHDSPWVERGCKRASPPVTGRFIGRQYGAQWVEVQSCNLAWREAKSGSNQLRRGAQEKRRLNTSESCQLRATLYQFPNDKERWNYAPGSTTPSSEVVCAETFKCVSV